MKKDINWINWAKLYGMILVYIYHTSFYLNIPSTGYALYEPFFVNIFFFVSGYLLFSRQLSAPVAEKPARAWAGGEGRTMLTNIICRIAIPTVIFSMINYFPKKILRGQEIDTWTFLHDTLLGGSLWFTCALTVAELLFLLLLLSRVRDALFYFAAAMFIAFAGYSMEQGGVTINGSQAVPWCYQKGMIAMLYMASGALFWKIEHHADRIFRGMRWLLPLSLYLLLLYILSAYSKGFCESFIINISGVLTLVYISKRTRPLKLADWIGRNTIGLYFLSGAVPNVLAMAYTKAFGTADSLSWLLLSVFSFALAVCIVWGLKKYTPFLFDIRTRRNSAPSP